MRHCFILVVMILAALAARPAAAADDQVELVLGTPIDWSVNDLAHTYVYWDQQGHGWTVRLTPGDEVDGKPQSVKMTVRSDNVAAATLSIDIDNSADNGTLAVYDFDAGLPTFLTTHYTMGAHCCYDVQAMVYTGKTLVATDVGSYDGGVEIRDIDGDGTDEIDTVDQRFLYAFDGYAGSRAAREIDKVNRTGIVTVTGDAGYMPYLMTQLSDELADCAADPGAGMCAGPLGTAAILGVYQSVAAEIPFDKIDNGDSDKNYLTCSKDDCGKDIRFRNAREAIEYRLKDWGYDTASSLSDQGRAYFKRFAAFPKGFAAAALPCGKDAVRLRLDPAAQFAELSGQDNACRIEKVNVLENAAVALGVCTSQGRRAYPLLALELDGDQLHMSVINKGVPNAKYAPVTLGACR